MARAKWVAWVRRAGIVALVIGLGYLVISIWDRDAIVRWMGDLSPVPFFAAMAVLPVIGMPLAPFTIVAGASFGVWLALIGSVAAIAAHLCLAYALAHSKLRPRIESLFERLDYRVPNFTAGGRAAWRFAAAIKLTPVLPAVAKMYILAVTSVPFPIYLGVSLVISSAFAAAWIVLGDSLLGHEIDHVTVAAIAIAVAVVAVLMWWRKRSHASDATAAV